MFLLRRDDFGVGSGCFHVFNVLERDNHIGSTFADDQRGFVEQGIFLRSKRAQSFLNLVF